MKSKKLKSIKKLSIVKWVGDKNFYIDCPFNQESRYIYYGEIPNMRGHCVISNTETGELFSGYHCSDFIIDEDL